MSIAIVIDKRAAGIPALEAACCSRGHTGLGGYIRKRAIAIVVIQGAITPIGNEQVVVSVVVIVPYAHALPPAGAEQPCLRGHVGECSVAIVLVKPIRRLFALGIHSFKAGAVH